MKHICFNNKKNNYGHVMDVTMHLMLCLDQRFSIPVLAPPPLCTFRMLLLSLQTFILFERKCPAKWTSHDIPP